MNSTIDFSVHQQRRKPAKSFGKKVEKMFKKRKESSRKNTAAKGTIWVPRVRHNYVPIRDSCAKTLAYPTHNKPIPFVCGQSISKTHNIGLKIQETLSSIKKEKARNNARNNNQFPRVFMQTYSQPEMTTKPNPKPIVPKKKLVDLSQLKIVFMGMYEDLSRMMENLKEVRNEPTNAENAKIAENVDQRIKKKELQISVTMGLYKEVMFLRKLLGYKNEKPMKSKSLFPNETNKKHTYRNSKEFQSGDH